MPRCHAVPWKIWVPSNPSTCLCMYTSVKLSRTTNQTCFCCRKIAFMQSLYKKRVTRLSGQFWNRNVYMKRRLVVQNLKMAWSRRFIPKLFVWHSSGDIVRMKWRYYRTGLYTEKKRSHWLKQWPIRKGLGDKKGELSLVEETTKVCWWLGHCLNLTNTFN